MAEGLTGVSAGRFISGKERTCSLQRKRWTDRERSGQLAKKGARSEDIWVLFHFLVTAEKKCVSMT